MPSEKENRLYAGKESKALWESPFAAACLFDDLEIFKKIVDELPYTVWINAADGLTLYLNKAGLKQRRHPKEFLENFNLLNDSVVEEMVPFEKLRRVLQGETVFFESVRVPMDTLIEMHGEKYEITALYEDITVFPIMEGDAVKYMVTLQIPALTYKGKKEIESAKEYINNNWYEKFNLDGPLKASGLSKAYFLRLFKRHTRMTPHEYYADIKIAKLKEKLCDPSVTVTEAFRACNLDYTGHFAGIFKDKTGLSPGEYKNAAVKGKNNT